MPTAAETVDRCALFTSLSPKARTRLAADLRERRYAAGEAMTSEDQGGVGFFLLGEGTAEVRVGDGAPAGTLGPGDTFGEMALITGERRSAGITAQTDVQCWVLSQWHFKPLVMENPELAWSLLEILALRVRDTQTRSTNS
jgi:CRP-like cAMP-binding protein